jgi:hypothetical protein
MNKLVFLDLEDTLIKSAFVITLNNIEFCNTEFIKETLLKEGTNKVHIFSFAIRDNSDKRIFEEKFKKPLEEHFSIEILSCLSVEEIMKDVFEFNSIEFEESEFTTIWGKLRAFHDYCNNNFTYTDCLLIDDTVPDSTFILNKKNLIIRTIKALAFK